MKCIVYRHRQPKKLRRYSDCWGWWTGVWFTAGRGVYIYSYLPLYPHRLWDLFSLIFRGYRDKISGI